MLETDVAGWQHQEVPSSSEPKLEELGDRVWYALNCQPRDEHERPPPPTRFEKPLGNLPRGSLGKIISGLRQEVRDPTLVRIANALKVPVAFLATGEGPRPTLTGPLFPRPRLYDANKKPIPVGISSEATSVVLDRLGLDEGDGLYISAPGEHDMTQLPPEGRDAAMATVYLEGCSVQEAMEAAVAALKLHGPDHFGRTAEGWMKPIREILTEWGMKRTRSSVRRIRTAAPPASNK